MLEAEDDDNALSCRENITPGLAESVIFLQGSYKGFSWFHSYNHRHSISFLPCKRTFTAYTWTYIDTSSQIANRFPVSAISVVSTTRFVTSMLLPRSLEDWLVLNSQDDAIFVCVICVRTIG